MVQILTLNTVLAMLLVAGMSPDMTVEWAKYTDPDNRFEILMPDSVQRHVAVNETPLGVLEYVSHVSFATGSSGNAHYVVSHCTYPLGTLHQDSSELVELMFEETVAGSVESVVGELVYRDRTTVSGCPALLWKVKSDPSQLNIKSKAVVVDNVFYCLQVTTSQSNSLVHDGEKFFDSFKLLRP